MPAVPSPPVPAVSDAVCVPNADVSVFMYHYIRDPIPADAKVIVQLSVPPKAFDAQMAHVRALADSGAVSLLSMDRLAEARRTNCYPGKRVFVFTADDGWIDTYTALAPIARKYQVPFAFAIITSKLGVDNFVTANEVKVLSQDPLFTIMSHSVSHEDQDVMPEDRERHEICDSKATLESLIGKPVTTFVFPSGRMSANSQSLLKECGYSLAFSTGFGKAWGESAEGLDIDRVRVFPESTPEYFDRFVQDRPK